ncbi:hypothetical protein [Haladaptatus sp. T7]|uniref:hypothetical protein n=1 Tax=Haladaptatus sp. T7 TaxID=2029368 RepID=UPI0021A2594C|nr:hypothetical protein [Haladaptatus sp. T7]GKZ13510.1 hypothetical protein HAL_13910 [Haladaptatus sp. T7]
MSPDGYSAWWTDPDYVSTVVGVLAAAALYFYSAWVNWGPTTVEITVVLLAVLLPTTLGYEIARRF